MTRNEEYVARTLECAEESILCGPDGFFVFWPSEAGGAHDAANLRIIADELDRRNAPWVAQIDAYFASVAA